MKDFYLKGTPKTPHIKFDPDNDVFEISGRSIPENSIEFYQPVIDWLDAYLSSPQSSTVLEIKLEYFNTSSSKCLVEIFRRMEKLYKNGNEARIKWFYEEEDEDMQESGEDFKGIIRMPIDMIVFDNER